MPVTSIIPDLWNDISVDVVSPISIVQAQANYLGSRTKGLVFLDMMVDQKEDRTLYNLYLLCPVLNNERYKISTFCTYGKYYPVVIVGESKDAQDQNEFIAYLKELFNSKHVKSIMDSLFAKINETAPALTKS